MKTETKQNLRELAVRVVADWNTDNQIGARVAYWQTLGVPNYSWHRTTSQAWVSDIGQKLVLISGKKEPVSISRLLSEPEFTRIHGRL